MAYQNNIPQPTDALSQSQSDILNNFAAIQTLIDVNHVDFASADQGKHKFVTFPVQGAAPAINAGEIGLYNALSTKTAKDELYLINSTGGTVPLTESQQVAGSPGWAYLPSGVLLKWGNSSATGLSTITFPAGATIPAFSNIFTIILTTAYVNASDGDGFVRLNNFLAPWTQFTVYGSHRTSTGAFGPVGFQFLAIGN